MNFCVFVVVVVVVFFFLVVFLCSACLRKHCLEALVIFLIN